MKIIFDHQIFSYQKYGGASKYFAELIHRLPKDCRFTTTIFSNNEYVKEYDLFQIINFFPNQWFRGQGRIMNELNKPYSLFQLYKKQYDIFHQTHFETYCLRAIGNKPMVTTFHDTNFSNYNKNDHIVNLQRKSIARANKIIAISHNTKNDLVNLFNIPEDKVEVIYHGIDHNQKRLINERIVENPYILFVGDRAGYKNFERFVVAFSHIADKYKDLSLVCTRNKFTANEVKYFKELKIEDRIIHISASEPILTRLYQDAEMFVFPSLYEGFGMPILEAMIQECPVVLANSSCFPEIAVDSGLYFDPLNIESIYESMRKVLDDSTLKAELIEKGKERVRFFSWDKNVEQHLNLYKSLI